MADRWTPETAELAAHILHGWFGACSCESSDDGDRKCAAKLLAALADAGLLVPLGGETRTQWGNRYDYSSEALDGRHVRRQDEADARWWAEQTGLHPAVVSRTVHTGPWEVVDDHS